LVATIRSEGPRGVERTFRFAPLSSGLDIVRNTLSQTRQQPCKPLRLMKRLALFGSAQFWHKDEQVPAIARACVAALGAHLAGSNSRFWKIGMDPLAAARALWLETHPLPRAEATTGNNGATVNAPTNDRRLVRAAAATTPKRLDLG
jgi:hypothetical protein